MTIFGVNFFDWCAVFLGILPLVFMLTVRGRLLGERGNKATTFFCTVFSLFLLRLGYLRISTNGGIKNYYDNDVLPGSDFLGQSFTFCAISVALMIAYYLRTKEITLISQKNDMLVLTLKNMGVDPDDLLRHPKHYHLIKSEVVKRHAGE